MRFSKGIILTCLMLSAFFSWPNSSHADLLTPSKKFIKDEGLKKFKRQSWETVLKDAGDRQFWVHGKNTASARIHIDSKTLRVSALGLDSGCREGTLQKSGRDFKFVWDSGVEEHFAVFLKDGFRPSSRYGFVIFDGKSKKQINYVKAIHFNYLNEPTCEVLLTS